MSFIHSTLFQWRPLYTQLGLGSTGRGCGSGDIGGNTYRCKLFDGDAFKPLICLEVSVFLVCLVDRSERIRVLNPESHELGLNSWTGPSPITCPPKFVNKLTTSALITNIEYINRRSSCYANWVQTTLLLRSDSVCRDVNRFLSTMTLQLCRDAIAVWWDLDHSRR